MNIYSNIINRYFDYCDDAWQVIGQCEDHCGQTVRKVINMRTCTEMYLGYEAFWNVTPRGYSHNGKVQPWQPRA